MDRQTDRETTVSCQQPIILCEAAQLAKKQEAKKFKPVNSGSSWWHYITVFQMLLPLQLPLLLLLTKTKTETSCRQSSVTWSCQYPGSHFWCGSRQYYECKSVRPVCQSVGLSRRQYPTEIDVLIHHHCPNCGQRSAVSLAAGPQSLVGIATLDNNLFKMTQINCWLHSSIMDLQCTRWYKYHMGRLL